MDYVVAVLFFPTFAAVAGCIWVVFAWYERRPNVNAPFPVVNWRTYRAARHRFALLAQEGDREAMGEAERAARTWLRTQYRGGGPLARWLAERGLGVRDSLAKEFKVGPAYEDQQ